MNRNIWLVGAAAAVLAAAIGCSAPGGGSGRRTHMEAVRAKGEVTA